MRATEGGPPGRIEHPEPAGQPLERWWPVDVELEAARRFPTEPGDEVTFGPGRVECAFRLSTQEPPSGWDPMDPFPPTFELRCRDADGAFWAVEAFPYLHLFTGALEPEQVEAAGVLFWSEAPTAWRDAMAERCIVRGLSDLLDGRDRFEMPVGSWRVLVTHKYQGPAIDLGWLETEAEPHIVVRASRLYVDAVRSAEGVVVAEDVDCIVFGYELDPRGLLPLVRPEAFVQDLEVWEDGEEGEALIFRPLADEPADFG